MSTLLTNILVPVDFTVNTAVAVKKAIEFAHTPGSIIHLVHVENNQLAMRFLFTSTNVIRAYKKKYAIDAMLKLKGWQEVINDVIPFTKVFIYFMEGSLHANILKIAKQNKAQLIIIAKSSRNKFFKLFDAVYPNLLAKSVNCPVLTIMTKSVPGKIKIIVVPVRSFIPYRKIELAIAFAKIDRAKIHIVTLQNKMAVWHNDRNYLIESYLLLKSKLTNTVEYHVLNGRSLPKSTLEYAKHIGADMILVNPFTETKISGLTCRHINDLLESTSKLQIVSVVPY